MQQIGHSSRRNSQERDMCHPYYKVKEPYEICELLHILQAISVVEQKQP